MARKGTQETKRKKKIKLDYVRVALIACFVYFCCTLVKQQLSLNEYSIKIADIKSHIESSNQRIEEIDELKSQAGTSQYIEEIARTQLGLVKPYEKIFIDVNK